MSPFQIRPEQPSDTAAIHALTTAAFAPMPYSDGSEPGIIDALRRDGDLTVSLVGLLDGVLIAHIAFSPVTIDGEHGGWFGLGPVSVHPTQQGRGFGGQILDAGIEAMQTFGAHGLALIGSPALYSRFGFTSGQLAYDGLPPHLVQHHLFQGPARTGTLSYARAFSNTQ